MTSDVLAPPGVNHLRIADHAAEDGRNMLDEQAHIQKLQLAVEHIIKHLKQRQQEADRP